MSKILVVYGSTTGNTQSVAEQIQSSLSGAGNEVSIFNGSEVSPEEIKNYDYSFIGSSTWGDGDLQDDMVDFVENMKAIDLHGSKVAIFACGMSSFPQFCHAGDVLEETAKARGAEIVGGKIYKIDGDIGDELDNVGQWAIETVK